MAKPSPASGPLARLTLALALPTAVACGVMASAAAERFAVLSAARALRAAATLAEHSGSLVHELQREQGYAALFVGSRGALQAPELAAQRLRTDARRAVFVQAAVQSIDGADRAHAAGAGQAHAEARDRLDQLDMRRMEVATLRAGGQAANGYFAATIGSLVKASLAWSRLAQGTAAADAMAAFVSLMQASERAAQERALGALGFASGRFGGELYRRFLAAAAEQELILRQFRRIAPAGQEVALDEALSGSAATEVERLRRSVADAGPDGRVAAAAAAAWLAAASERIDRMNIVERALARAVAAASDRALADAQRSLFAILAQALGLAAATALAAAMLLHGTVRPIERLRRRAALLLRGESADEALPGSGNGALAPIDAALSRLRAASGEIECLRAEIDVARARAEGLRRAAGRDDDRPAPSEAYGWRAAA